MSLSNDRVLRVLRDRFVCGWKDISGEPYAGKSGRHDVGGQAVATTNGAGQHNVQMFFLDRDGTVLHCLMGFWAPDDLLREVDFALSMDKLYRDPKLSPAEKQRRFVRANLAHRFTHPLDMIARSHLQGFDADREAQNPASDFFYRPGDPHPILPIAGKHPELKTTDQILHERMVRRPFVAYDQFDVAEFTHYGKERYDKKEDTKSPNVPFFSRRR